MARQLQCVCSLYHHPTTRKHDNTRPVGCICSPRLIPTEEAGACRIPSAIHPGLHSRGSTQTRLAAHATNSPGWMLPAILARMYAVANESPAPFVSTTCIGVTGTCVDEVPNSDAVITKAPTAPHVTDLSQSVRQSLLAAQALARACAALARTLKGCFSCEAAVMWPQTITQVEQHLSACLPDICKVFCTFNVFVSLLQKHITSYKPCPLIKFRFPV